MSTVPEGIRLPSVETIRQYTALYDFVDGVYQGPDLFHGFLILGKDVKSLGNLKCVTESIDATNSSLEDLGCLEEVRQHINLKGSKVTSLKNLRKVGGSLSLEGTLVRDIGALDYVGLEFRCYNEEGWGYLDLKPHQIRATIRNFLKNGVLEDYPTYLNSNNVVIKNIVDHYLDTGEATEMESVQHTISDRIYGAKEKALNAILAPIIWMIGKIIPEVRE